MARTTSLSPAFATATPDPRTARLTDLANRVSRVIGVALALADGGRNLDLTGIDDGVGRLCAQTLDLDFEDARLMLPVLREVLAHVEALHVALKNGVRHPPATS